MTDQVLENIENKRNDFYILALNPPKNPPRMLQILTNPGWY